VSDALWSFATPPLVFPRPAFEVWLPLPSFLAAIPMAFLGPTFAASQVSSVLIGSVVPVLAWRYAADVAADSELPIARLRTLALGSGLTAAAYLPLLLHSALPDSTMPFAALAIAACILMGRMVREPPSGGHRPGRLVFLGLLLGLAALARNEALWLAVVWIGMVVFARPGDRASRLRLIGLVGVVAFVVVAPWAIRDWQEFGSPLPGQAAINALSISGYDIFAWRDPPNLARYLAVGPARLMEMRVQGLVHNFGSVLLLPGFPVSLIGFLGAPGVLSARSLRPLIALSLLVFLAASLLFPVATTWGTFLHAAGPVHVLLIISALLGLDRLLALATQRRSWTRQVAWLGALLGMSSSLLFTAVLLPSFGQGSRATAATYAELGKRLADSGHAIDAPGIRLMSNFPIWVAETQRVSTLALPDEPPAVVLDLVSAFPGTRYLVLTNPEGKHWPADLAAGLPGSACFRPIDLGPYAGSGVDPLATTTVYAIDCAAGAT
jgi:hypothetical protein